jgi:hypothetical protein
MPPGRRPLPSGSGASLRRHQLKRRTWHNFWTCCRMRLSQLANIDLEDLAQVGESIKFAATPQLLWVGALTGACSTGTAAGTTVSHGGFVGNEPADPT